MVFTRNTLALGIVGLLALLTAPGCKTVLEIRETPVGALPPGVTLESVIVSPDTRHVFWKVERDGKTVVVVDGVEGKAYDKVYNFPPVFSPDGKRWGYTARLGEKRYLVIDGRTMLECDRIDADGPVFSPDSRRVACGVYRGSHEYYAVDGVVGPPFGSRGEIFFSPDSRHVAYWGRFDGKARVVLDHRMFDGVYDGIGSTGFRFSPDSRRLVWMGFRGEKQFAVTDGAEGPQFDGIGKEVGIQFSADSRHMAYHARNGQMWKVVVDGVEGPWYDALYVDDGIALGPGGRTAYRARRQGKDLIVTGGREVPLDGVLQMPGCFFDRAGRLYYAIRIGSKRRILIDGKEGEPFDFIAEDSPCLSPDGSRVAWKMIRGDDWFFIIDGVKTGPYANIAKGDPIFSPDGRHFVYRFRFLLPDEMWQLVFDGKPIRQPGRFAYEQFSPDGRRFAFSEWQGEKARIVLHDAEGKGAEETWAEGKWYDGIRGLLLGPDGRHCACGAKSGDRHLLVVDGLESPGYDAVPKDAQIVFDSPTTVNALFIKSGALVHVRAELRQVCR
jgi:hypothetical protein